MGRVFVVHQTLTYDRQSGGMRPVHDISMAHEFGKVVHLLPSGTLPDSTEEVVRQLQAKLSDYGDTDSILLIGSPMAMALAAAIAARANAGRIKLLRWEPELRRYFKVEAEV